MLKNLVYKQRSPRAMCLLFTCVILVSCSDSGGDTIPARDAALMDAALPDLARDQGDDISPTPDMAPPDLTTPPDKKNSCPKPWTTLSSGTTRDLYAIRGDGQGNIYFTGTGGTLLKYDGTSWTPLKTGTTNNLYALWAHAGTVLAGGSYGTLVRVTKGGAKAEKIGDINVEGIWGASLTDIHVIGGTKTGRYDGKNWTIFGAGYYNEIHTAVAGLGSKEVYRTSYHDRYKDYVYELYGTLERYDGKSWTSDGTFSDSPLTALWVEPGGNIAVAGLACTNTYPSASCTDFAGYRQKGKTWDYWSENKSFEYYRGIWSGGPGQVYAVGMAGFLGLGRGGAKPAVYRTVGSKWTAITPAGLAKELLAVWGDSKGSVYVAGKSGVAYRYCAY